MVWVPLPGPHLNFDSTSASLGLPVPGRKGEGGGTPRRASDHKQINLVVLYIQWAATPSPRRVAPQAPDRGRTAALPERQAAPGGALDGFCLPPRINQGGREGSRARGGDGVGPAFAMAAGYGAPATGALKRRSRPGRGAPRGRKVVSSTANPSGRSPGASSAQQRGGRGRRTRHRVKSTTGQTSGPVGQGRRAAVLNRTPRNESGNSFLQNLHAKIIARTCEDRPPLTSQRSPRHLGESGSGAAL